VTKRLTEIDEYLEKVAAGKFPSPGLFEGILNIIKRRPVASAAVGLGLGGLGTLGVLHAAGGDLPGQTLSYRVNRELNSLTDRIRADEQFGEAFAKQLGSSSANELIGLTKDMMTKGYETMKDSLSLSPARSAIFDSLRSEDPDLAATDKGTLMEAYHTMSRFAPTLSTDKNAVKSFLRTVATSPEGGTDFNTIKLLAEAENAINGPVAKKGG
jgi:hypothetical protein